MRPRIRTIKPEMWDDERVGALSRDARILLVGLITMADDEGRFRARRSAILGHVFPYDDDAIERIGDWIKEIKKQELIVFYVVDGNPYGAFRHWARHQRINRPQPSELPPSPDPKITRNNRAKGASKNSRSNHGSISDRSVITHHSTRRRAVPDPIPSDPILSHVPRLCRLMADGVVANDPKANPDPTKPSWERDMRLLIADRGGDEGAIAEVERVMRWAQADHFWRGNVLSPGSLRAKFTQLLLKMEQPANVVPFRKESPSEIFRALQAAKQEQEQS